MSKALADCIKVQKINGTYNTELGAIVRQIMAEYYPDRPRRKRKKKGYILATPLTTRKVRICR